MTHNNQHWNDLADYTPQFPNWYLSAQFMKITQFWYGILSLDKPAFRNRNNSFCWVQITTKMFQALDRCPNTLFCFRNILRYRYLPWKYSKDKDWIVLYTDCFPKLNCNYAISPLMPRAFHAFHLVSKGNKLSSYSYFKRRELYFLQVMRTTIKSRLL